MKLYNSLSREIEEISPINPPKVSMYTCGPTVYSYLTIGNWRTYVLSDLLVRAFTYAGNEVDFVMNITDVGHLTGDNEGDSSMGEDRNEKAAKKEGKSAWDLAKFYADDFLDGFDQLNLIKPKKFTKATDYIKEQIDLVQAIIDKGFSYVIEEDGIYFDVVAYETSGNSYGDLSNIDQIKEGVRVAVNENKKDPRDFALWKFSPKNETRQMEWPYEFVLPKLEDIDEEKDYGEGLQHIKGMGFPGWHVECSAMIMAELGNQIDLHVGGEDLRSTHHPNEIAQSECATGEKPFAKYWIHGAFLQVDGGRMGKSMGNAYTLEDIEKKSMTALSLRYFYLTGHYRKPLNFTWKALEQADQAYDRMKGVALMLTDVDARDEGREGVYTSGFDEVISNDLNMPQALAVTWKMLRDKDLPQSSKKFLLGEFDKIFGLNLLVELEEKIPEDILIMVEKREQHRKDGDWKLADVVRDSIKDVGYEIADMDDGPVVRKI